MSTTGTRGAAQQAIDKRDADREAEAAKAALHAKAAAIDEEIERDFDTALALVAAGKQSYTAPHEVTEIIRICFDGVRKARKNMETAKDKAIAAMCKVEYKKREAAE